MDKYRPLDKKTAKTHTSPLCLLFPCRIILLMDASNHLPADFILQLKAEWEADVHLLEILPKRIAERRRRYEAALLFAPDGFDPSAPLAAKSELPQDKVNNDSSEFTLTSSEEIAAANRPSWVVAVRNVLEGCDHGLTHREVFDRIKKAIPDMPTSNGEKGFYNAIARLSERGQLVKHGGFLYSPKVLSGLKARGKDLPELPGRTRPGGSGEIVLSLLREHKEGLTGPELKRLAASVPDAPRSLIDHGQYIYNILGALIGNGAVVKDDGIYKLNRADK